MPVRRYPSGSNARLRNDHRSLDPPPGPAQSIFRSLKFLPSQSRRPDLKRAPALFREELAARKKLREIQEGVAQGKHTLEDLEVAANKAFALEWEVSEFKRGYRTHDEPEIRLARLRFTVAYQNLEVVVDGLWDGTRTLKEAETALRAVHKILAAGNDDLTKAKNEKAKHEKQISGQMATLRKALEKRRKEIERDALRNSKTLNAGTKHRQSANRQGDIELERAMAAARKELHLASKRATWLEHRAAQGTASFKQAEAALIAESQALRKFTEAKGRLEISWRVASSLRRAKADLAELEQRKKAAARAEKERQKKLRFRESLVVEEVKRLKSSGGKRLEEWRLVYTGVGHARYLGVAKIAITRTGRTSTVRSILHKMTEDVFGPDASLPIPGEEAVRNDLEKLRESLTTGFPAVELQSDIGRVLSHMHFERSGEQSAKELLVSELSEVLQAFEKPVLPEKLLEPA